MLRYLASGLLTRNVSRRLAHAIPNPLVRTVAIAAAGYAVNRIVNGRPRRARLGAPLGAPVGTPGGFGRLL